jgi:hypothetical protein
MQDLILHLHLELGSGREGRSEGKEKLVIFIERHSRLPQIDFISSQEKRVKCSNFELLQMMVSL